MNMMTRLVFLVGALTVQSAQAGGWVDDWLSQSTQTPSGSFSGQQRNYYSGGSYSARWRTTTDNPVSFQAPSIKSGCGGIDIFKGGMSLADPEYLVSKFQSMIQAAPAVAFDIALKTMSKDMSETMKSITATIDTLNGLQLNDCAIAKRAVVSIKDDKDVSGVASDVWNEISGDQSLQETVTKNWQNHNEQINSSGGKSPAPLDNAVKGCSAEFKAFFSNGGSVIDNVTKFMEMSDYADILRGYLGDLWIEKNSATNAYTVIPIQSCQGNTKEGPDDFLYGNARSRASGKNGTCGANSATKLMTYVDTSLQTIAKKLATKAALDANDTAFINNTNHQVYLALKGAVANRTVVATIAMLRDPIAHQLAYRVMDDLFLMADKALDTAQRGAYQGGANASCNISVLRGAITPLQDFRTILWTSRSAAQAAYGNSLKELTTSLTVAEKNYKDWQAGQGDLARQTRRK